MLTREQRRELVSLTPSPATFEKWLGRNGKIIPLTAKEETELQKGLVELRRDHIRKKKVQRKLVDLMLSTGMKTLEDVFLFLKTENDDTFVGTVEELDDEITNLFQTDEEATVHFTDEVTKLNDVHTRETVVAQLPVGISEDGIEVVKF